MKNNFTGITANISPKEDDDVSMIIMARAGNNRCLQGTTDYCPADSHNESGEFSNNVDPTDPANNRGEAATLISESGTISGMQWFGNEQTAGKFLTITYMKNGAAQTLEVQVGSGANDGLGNSSEEDQDHSFHVDEGDLIALRWRNDAGNFNQFGSVSCRFKKG